MLQISSFVLWQEVKYRCLIIVICSCTLFFFQFNYSELFVLYPTLIAFFFQYVNKYSVSDIVISNNSTFLCYKKYYYFLHYYPELEYTTTLMNYYYIDYSLVILTFLFILVPLLLYHIYIYFRPAIYIHEIKLFNKFLLLVSVVALVALVITYFSFQYTISSSLPYTSLNVETYFNQDIHQLLKYFLLLFLLNSIFFFFLFFYILFIHSYLNNKLYLIFSLLFVFFAASIIPFFLIILYIICFFSLCELRSYLCTYQNMISIHIISTK